MAGDKETHSEAHWQYYLGYSDHQSFVKAVWLATLKSLGFSSQEECPEPTCQQRFQRGREECQRR